jgi:hypothetical protein
MPTFSQKIGSFLERLKDVFRKKQIPREQERSVEWLRAHLDDFSAYTRQLSPRKTLKEIETEKREVAGIAQTSVVGQMYMYHYSAKHYKTLPYWDRFPLSIIVSEAKGGFYALNLHYIPIVYRAKLFDALLDTLTTNQIVNEKSRLAITYNLLKSTQKYKYFRPCFKHYLTQHVKSKAHWIHPEDWWRTIFLENAQWQKASRTTVYFDARKMIN